MNRKSLLVVAPNLPTPDRASGDLRLFSLLRALRDRYDVTFCAYGASGQSERLGATEFSRYADDARGAGLQLHLGDPVQAAVQGRFDIVLFEFYFAARLYLDELRFRMPGAQMVIDTVDIHFNRLQSLARLTGSVAARQQAAEVMAEELSAYRAADALVVVSDDERKLLGSHAVTVPAYVIANFHELAPLEPKQVSAERLELLFVGGFAHDPNVDAVIYFCQEVLQRVLDRYPNARLTVVGGNPPAEVLALASNSVSILGYVRDIAPIFLRSHISVAPLRFGGGIKGKVGEAMAEGLPVVTTLTGVEGLSVTHGVEVMVATDAAEFAEHIIALAAEPGSYARVREAAWHFVESSLSARQVGQWAIEAFAAIEQIAPRQPSTPTRLRRAAKTWIDRHVSWRFQQS